MSEREQYDSETIKQALTLSDAEVVALVVENKQLRDEVGELKQAIIVYELAARAAEAALAGTPSGDTG